VRHELKARGDREGLVVRAVEGAKKAAVLLAKLSLASIAFGGTCGRNPARRSS
jgi:hypothetical protein